MIHHLTDEIINDINAILTAASILEETIDKRSPNVDKEGKPKQSRAISDAVNGAMERLLGTTASYSCFTDD